ncbi:MAG TPA: type 4a pilus biogenesis protein PilO [Gammaproteobacteria bacterium]|nr:type 4a pilus biogenesis protein PilO [Gammaproteobacteria bacterium]
MNIIEELQSLDINEPGRWPVGFRIAAVVIVFVAVSAFGVYMLVYKTDIPDLRQAETQEMNLRSTFEARQRLAASFDAYREQLAEIERSFGTMLRQLPGRTEVDNLLVDISQTGLGAGLEEELFRPLGERRADFYAELPIEIRLRGSYHELGEFASGIAALPRIVTLHDIDIAPASNEGDFDDLLLNVTAKTYRYLEEEELEEE